MNKKVKLIETHVVDISHLLGKVNNRIDKVGIELEGGFKNNPPGQIVERDTSVKPWETDADRRAFPLVGEVISTPKMPAGIGVWMRKCYPGIVNASCGLHFHMSFKKTKYYAMLMEKEFQETMCHFLGLWAKEENLDITHPIWDRLEGRVEYCTKNFWPDLQVGTQRKDYDHHRLGNRYTAISYRWYEGLKTIEVRVLPMMKDPEMGVRAVKRGMDITNAFLVAVGEKDKGLECAVPTLPGDEWEEATEVRL